MRKHLSTLLLAALLLFGVGLILYPTVSDVWNRFHQSRAIAGYTEDVQALDPAEAQKMWDAAEAYNQALWSMPDRYRPDDAAVAQYLSLLDVSGTGIMCYVEVPRINVSLPVYHGIDDSILQIAVGHIVGSSLPIGGPGTHSVLSGHRGLPSARLFTDLDQVTQGDVFYIQVLGRTLTYAVDQIRIVLPNELQDLELVEGQDYCTLVTCTPYGVNSHRLLVRGRRIADGAAGTDAPLMVTNEATQFDPILVAPALAAPILLLLLLVALLRARLHGGGKSKQTGEETQ